ncbi:MAG TPA: Hsp20/alpha crystallin family protein, partial [Burkholderiaceae bacterium]|nr:Hsp20/alpha crystallin family protein [Burkholderiaceae bacterium]
MDRMFEQFGMGGFTRGGQLQQRGAGGMSSLWSPQVEMYERDGKLHVCADLPGLNKDDIEVNIENDTVTIRGERQSQHEDRDEQRGFYRSERSYGSFYRAIPLPEGVNAENGQATFRDGVLDITFDAPKQTEGRGRRLEISDASSSTGSASSAEKRS